jgi:hypothetical protein
LALAVGLAVAAPAALASKVALHVSRTAVVGGQRIAISGNAGACPRGDSVLIISKALASRTKFAGVPDVSARVGKHGAFSTPATIAHVAPGLYNVSARCGGGNLGVAALLSVTHR